MSSWKRNAGVVVSAIAVSLGPTAMARAEVDTRSTLALTYREGSGSEVDMVGTGVGGRLGTADVKRSDGRTRIKIKLKELPHPQTLGSLYTAYVLWAVAPEGRAENLAELPHSKSFDVDATTALPTFGLIVTAEPDAAVTRPGPRLVAQNAINDDTKGRIQSGKVQYETSDERMLEARGVPDLETPLPVLGARKAVLLAKAAGASRYAEEELRDAETKLQTAEQLWSGKDHLSKEAEAAAREAMRLGEHARSVTSEREVAAGLSRERIDARRAVNRAKTAAEAAADQAAWARAQAEQARTQASQAEAQASLERQQAQQARAQADDAMMETAKAKASVMEAEGAAAQARLDAQQARQDLAAAQEQMYRSLSAILETRREARGLIVSLSDVLFDFNQASLTPGAREKLSKLSGILIAYPGTYRIDVEGHTDSVGTPEYNLGLSRGRAQSVASYIAQAGIPPDRMGAVTGFGETRPVASNDDAAGRQQNRRVELVIAGLEGQEAR